jgi:hypothetical protein
MGVDAQIGVRGSFTEDDIEKVKKYLSSRYLVEEFDWLKLYEKGICFYDGTRFYGEGYERGNWPHIYALIRAFMSMFPNNEVIYYEDLYSDEDALNSHYVEAQTEESLQQIWAHFLGDKGTAYSDYWNEWNERNNK